ncbi:hypothetical protein J2T09_004896 [Neorhizobium huautlense]|uniref:Uncharacterized protein n=1 Tax=Neorhizobium huautlense TaxID=67774 RepID=A0ABT9Q051_9HYPH|nr:hypothetical protein [Neorhizobium huautlense]MDP9840116.1 hypothetical protein [Neorhizobium huautlense]
MITDAEWVRYSAVEETESGWSVVENATGLAVLVEGVPMVLLRKDIAFALVQTLNEIVISGRTFH